MARGLPSTAEAAAGRRRHSRLRVHLPARLITLDGTLQATLLNLSFKGARVLLGTATLRCGASAVLTWGKFETFCNVAWAQGGHCGLDFDEPLRPQVLIATRDLADGSKRVDANRVAAEHWATGLVNRL